MRELGTEKGGPVELHSACAPAIHGFDVILRLLRDTIGDKAREMNGDIAGNVLLRSSYQPERSQMKRLTRELPVSSIREVVAYENVGLVISL